MALLSVLCFLWLFLYFLTFSCWLPHSWAVFLCSHLYICRKGQLDVRELISLYPLLLPASSSFTRCHPPLHEFADLNHLAQGDQEKVLLCKKFLISYLGEVSRVRTDLFTQNFALNPLVISYVILHMCYRLFFISSHRYEAQRWPMAVERMWTLHC